MTAPNAEGEAGAPGGGLTTSPSPLDDLFPGRLGVWAGWVLGTVAATVLFAMMVLTFVDVTGRKLFTHPVYGAYEITEFLMGALIFSALPLVTAREGHVTIDVLDHLLPAGLARWQRVVVNTISTAALAFVAWRLWELSTSHMRTHEVTMTLHIPHGPFSRLFAVMAALAAVACLVILWGYLSGGPSGPLRVRRSHFVTETLLAFAGLLGLAFARIPVAFSMLIVGIAGFAWKRGIPASLDQLAQTTFAAGINYELSVVPLFILMGNLVARAGMSQELFRAAYAFIGHWRGGLAMSTIMACAGFGAICGSSIATAATMTRVAYPPMRQLGYSDKLAASSIAAGGTLGILIPPSTIMVIYGIMTETNIGRLFAAGVLPGILAAFLLCMAVRYMIWREPESGPAGARSSWAARWRALRGVWGVVALFALSIGGIYAGIFTATEGAGIGAFGAFVFALARRSLSLAVLRDVLLESARTTSMLFMILIGALVFANFINFTTMPRDLQHFVERFAVHPTMVVAAMCAIYVILGTAMEELSMILLTVPVFFPVIVSLGLDPVWFGILIVVVVEIGLISPPVGMNLFVINALLPHVPTPTLFRGVTPFVVADVVRLAILIAFPIISLWLPSVLRIAGKGY